MGEIAGNHALRMLKLQKAGQLQDVVTARGGTGTWGCGPAGEQSLEGQDPGGAEDKSSNSVLSQESEKTLCNAGGWRT